LTTTRRDYLQINAVEPYGWGATGGSSETVFTVYQHNNFKGWSKSFGIGRFNQGKDFPNDAISSYKIKDGFCVTVFEHEVGKGNSVEICGPK